MRLFFKLLFSKLAADRINGYAAQMAYTMLLSFFPLILFAGFIFSQIHIDLSPIYAFIQENVSSRVYEIVSQFLQSQMNKTQLTLLSPIFAYVVISISFGLQPLIRAMNEMYNVKDTRGWIRTFSISLIGTIFLMLSITLSVILFLLTSQFQSYIIEVFPLFDSLQWVWRVLSFVLLVLFMFIFLIFAYTLLPAKRYRMRFNIRAAMYSTILWVVMSFGFVYYVLYINRTYNVFYGSLTTIIALVVWFYFSSIAILLGLEIEMIREQIKNEVDQPDIENHFMQWLDFYKNIPIFNKKVKK